MKVARNHKSTDLLHKVIAHSKAKKKSFKNNLKVWMGYGFDDDDD